MSWQGAGTKLPDGRKVIEWEDGRWAIFEHDQTPPETVNGGVLWLNRDRCLDASTRHEPLIPVVAEVYVQDRFFGRSNDTKHSDTPTILFLSRLLNWTIVDEVRGHYYNVR